MSFLRYAMLPAPARMAAPPSPSSSGSWNPAVPPPPVAGAAGGTGLAGELLLGLGDGDEPADRLDEGRADRVGDAPGDRLARAPGVVVAPAGPPDEVAGVAGLLLAGDDVGGSAAEGEDVVQAEIAAQATMAAKQHAALRTFME
jgi:hypothetical protein